MGRWACSFPQFSRLKIHRVGKFLSQYCKKRLQTWCHCRPLETPARPCATGIRVEEDVHGVGQGRYDWRQEVTGRSFRASWSVATAPVHQGCPVPICDFDIVSGTRLCPIYSNLGELYPQHFATLHPYCLCPIQVVGIILRVVWRGDNTCGNQSFKLNSTKGICLTMFSTSLTLAATAVCRTSCWGDLPESGSSGRVRDTSKVDPG